MLSTKNPAFPSGIAVAHTTVVGAGEIARGDQLPSDDWRVLTWPERFIDSLVPASQWPIEGATIPGWAERAESDRIERERRAFEEAAAQNVVRLELPGVMTCHTDHLGRVDGRPATIKRGSKALASDDVVAQSPASWKAEK